MDRPTRANRTALVVDDDVFLVSAMAELLSEEGYDVHTASNGFSAVRQASESRPAIVLLDLVLPERSGIDVLVELRADPATRDLAIVIVTGNAHMLTDAHLADVDGVLEKPFDASELLATVHRAVNRAASRQVEVPPVAAVARREPLARSRRPQPSRRTHGRR